MTMWSGSPRSRTETAAQGTSGRAKAKPPRGRLRRALTRPENPAQGQACPTEEIPRSRQGVLRSMIERARCLPDAAVKRGQLGAQSQRGAQC